MKIDVQNDNQVQQNDIRELGDDELSLVQGGAGLFDFAKLFLNALNNALHMGTGRPQV